MTLVELLLAVAILSAILGAVSFLVLSCFKVHLGWGQAADGYRRMEQGLARLEQDLESAQPIPGVVFAGTQDMLQFARVELVPDAEGALQPDWVRVTYHLDGQALIRESIAWRRGAEAEPVTETLLPLADGAFAFGVRDPQDRVVWAEAWDGEAYGQPRLVQLTGTVQAAPGLEPFALTRLVRNPSGALPRPEPPP